MLALRLEGSATKVREEPVTKHLLRALDRAVVVVDGDGDVGAADVAVGRAVRVEGPARVRATVTTTATKHRHLRCDTGPCLTDDPHRQHVGG